VRWLSKLFEFVGKVGLFSLRVVVDSLRSPFEFCSIFRSARRSGKQINHPHRRVRLRSGSRHDSPHKKHPGDVWRHAMIPAVQAVSFFVEIGPLVAGLLLACRVGSGIGAVLANMRVSEQIDAIESLSIDSFKFLVVPRVLTCVIALPLLTLFMDFAGLLGGFVSEELSSHITPVL
jgi:phospholipid/cholesterol/gamma-HCH transport system permease protein